MEFLLDKWDKVYSIKRHGPLFNAQRTENFVIATSKQYSVCQFIEWSAAALGVAVCFEGEGVDEKRLL